MVTPHILSWECDQRTALSYNFPESLKVFYRGVRATLILNFPKFKLALNLFKDVRSEIFHSIDFLETFTAVR